MKFFLSISYEGVEYPDVPDVGDVPLICDASSNFLTRPKDITKYALVYAGVQKNVGCAGVTVVIGESASVQCVCEVYMELV